MKLMLFVSMMLLSSFGLTQQCTQWFPFEKGAEFEYTFYSDKGKEVSRTYYFVKDIVKNGSNYEANIQAIIYDKKGNESRTLDFSVSCQNGVYQADLSNFMNQTLKESFGDAEVKVEGALLEFPAQLKVGQTLPDANSNMEAQLGPIKMKMFMEISERKVADKVEISTPVRTFSSYKITAKERIKVPLFDRSYDVVYYYSEGVGQVKSEYYDKKGALDSYMLLTALKK